MTVVKFCEYVFKSFLKSACVCAWRIVSGSQLNAAGPAHENACSPLATVMCNVYAIVHVIYGGITVFLDCFACVCVCVCV